VTMIGLEGQMTSVGVTAQLALSAIEGVNFEFQPLPPLGMRDAVFGKSFDIAAWLLSGDAVYPDLVDYLATGSPRNASGFSSPVIDEAFATAIATDDPEVIKQSYQTVVREVLDQLPYALLWRTHVSTYAQDNVKGLEVINDNVVDLSTIYLD
jgi:ABC-type transport system substrate-binding protein